MTRSIPIITALRKLPTVLRLAQAHGGKTGDATEQEALNELCAAIVEKTDSKSLSIQRLLPRVRRVLNERVNDIEVGSSRTLNPTPIDACQQDDIV